MDVNSPFACDILFPDKNSRWFYMGLSIVPNKLAPQEMFYRCCASLTLIWRVIYGLVILYTVLYLSSLVSVMDIFDDWRDARRQQTPLMYCVRQSGDIHIKKTPQRNSGSLFFLSQSGHLPI